VLYAAVVGQLEQSIFHMLLPQSFFNFADILQSGNLDRRFHMWGFVRPQNILMAAMWPVGAAVSASGTAARLQDRFDGPGLIDNDD